MSLIKTMIVDDEILALNYIKNLISWESRGFYLVAETTSAARALEYMTKYKPKVIFMDIRMPVMDGLELSRKILDDDPSVKILLLTSYRDFEYAKKALDLGIFSYLLKHELNAESLLEQLHKLKNHIESENKKELEVIGHNLRDLFDSGVNSGAIMDSIKRRINQYGGSFIFLYVCMDTPFPVIELAANRLYIALKDTEQWSMENLAEDLIHVNTIVLGKGRLGVLFSCSNPHSDYRLQSQLHMAASKLQKLFKQKFNITASIICSPLFNHIGQLLEIHQDFEKKIENLIFYGREKILHLSGIQLGDNFPSAELKAALQNFRNDLKNRKEETVFEHLQTMFGFIKPNCFQPRVVRLLTNELILTLEQLREMAGMPTYTDLLTERKIDIQRWYCTDDIKLWFFEEFTHIGAHINKSGSDKYSRKVQQAIQYIHKHYEEELSIEMLGEKLSISGDRLRHLYKEETGQTVIEYLTWYRMEMAKGMLKEKNLKVYEVAARVGYRTSQYFSQVFKKVTGETPQEFMEREV